MKRLIALLLVFMLSVPFFAVAEGIDVKALDNDALVMLYTQAQAEALDRGLLQVLPAGVYTGDGDLPKGMYVCQCLKDGSIKIYRSFEDYLSDKIWKDIWYPKEDEQFSMRLSGNLCYVITCPAIVLSFTPAAE